VTTSRSRALAASLSTLPALLLVAVATLQIALARTEHLSPWSGGGFGMFASTDSPARRHIHAWALRPGLRTELEIPRELETLARRALALPIPWRMRPLAEALARIEAEEGDPDAAPVDAVSLQVFGASFDPETLAPSGELLRSIEVRAPTP
jgi:hypothetical protein